jgi:hypothetical protein
MKAERLEEKIFTILSKELQLDMPRPVAAKRKVVNDIIALIESQPEQPKPDTSQVEKIVDKIDSFLIELDELSQVEGKELMQLLTDFSKQCGKTYEERCIYDSDFDDVVKAIIKIRFIGRKTAEEIREKYPSITKETCEGY